MKIKRTVAINGIAAADAAIAEIDERGVALVERNGVILEIRQSRDKGGYGQELGKGFTVTAIVPRPEYGGLAKTFSRRVADRKYVRSALAFRYNEAFEELRMQKAREILYTEFDAKCVEAQKDQAFIDEIERVETETGHTAIWADMNADDISFWRAWLANKFAITV